MAEAKRARYATKAAIAQVVAAARAVGLDINGLEVFPDGSIRVLERRPIPTAGNDFDRFEAQL